MEIITRAEWGARYESAYQNLSAPLPAQETWLHHSVTLAPDLVQPFDDDYRAIRAIEQIGEDRFGWGMSYTFLVTPVGLVFEGHRINGQGTHTGGRNGIARGICLVGDYENNEPTDVQLLRVAELLVEGYLRKWWERPAFNGGHRDLKSTACPGKYAYAKIEKINALAKAILEGDMLTAAQLWGYTNEKAQRTHIPSMAGKDAYAMLIRACDDARIVRQEIGSKDWQDTPGKVANLETRVGRIETTLGSVMQKLDTLLNR